MVCQVAVYLCVAVSAQVQIHHNCDHKVVLGSMYC